MDRLVKMHVTLDDEHKKAANRRSIESILNGYTNTRTDIADIAVVTNTGEYITSEKQDLWLRTMRFHTM